MGLFDFFKKNKNDPLPDDEDFGGDDRWEEPGPEPEAAAAYIPPEGAYTPPEVPLWDEPVQRQETPLWDEPVQRPNGWPVMEPVSISEKVMQFMQEHTQEEIDLAASNAAAQGMKAFQAQEFESARGLFQLGSELGNHKAQALLGSMYIKGYQVPRDLAVGRAWLRRSAEQGNRQAAEMLARYVGESEPVAEELYESAKANMGADRRTGMYYLNRAAEMGLSRAQYEYGVILIREDGDDAKGIDWVKRAAFGGYAQAMTYLGNAYFRGDVVPQSTSIAIEWYEQAIKKDDPEAQLALGTIYAEGTAVRAQPDAAIRLLTLAADSGLSEAREMLRKMFSRSQFAQSMDAEGE